MDSLKNLNIFEVRALIKLVAAQATMQETLDQVCLPALADRLRKALTERGAGAGVMDMRHGNFDFKIQFDSKYRVTMIKLIRQVMGLGLKEAKDLSDTGYDEALPFGVITFTNSTQELYDKFVEGRSTVCFPSTDMSWRNSELDAANQAGIQITAITQVTPVEPD